jgi:hypothetical protein
VETGNDTAAPDNATELAGPRVTVKIDLPEILAIALHGHPRKLKDELRAINNELKETATTDTKLDLTRKAAALQLGTAILWLQWDPEIVASNDHQPLIQLFMALQDLCAGGKPALLCGVARPDDVKTKPKIASAHYAQGILVLAYMALGRVKWKPAATRDWLDEELRERNMHERVCGEDIHRWHSQYTAPTGRLAPTARDTIRDWEAALLRLQDDSEAQAFARRCLDTVDGLGLERIRLRETS